MKKVILIGDSIRIGYESKVRADLAGWADVWTPAEENCGHSRNILEHLNRWVLSRRPDIVHINCGLHDLARDQPAGQPRVGLDEYARNVRSILQQILSRTGARVIWSMATPTHEQHHREVKNFDRFEVDVVEYNRAACAVAGELSVPINDLYALVMTHGRDQLLLSDGVHFTAAGYELLGSAVARIIKS